MITHFIHFFSFCPTTDMNADKMVLWVMWVEIDHQHPTFLHINHQTVHYIIFTIALIIQSAFFVGITIDLLLSLTFSYYLAIRSNTRSQRLRRQWVFFNFLSNTFLENVWWWVMTNLYPCYFNLPKPLDALHSIQPHFAHISYDSYMTSIFKQVGQVELLKQRVGLVDGSSFFFFFLIVRPDPTPHTYINTYIYIYLMSD